MLDSMATRETLPAQVPWEEDDTTPLEERLEERFGLGGKSLRRHTAQGALINAAFQIALAIVGLLKRFGVAAYLTTTEYGLWGLLITTLITLGWLKQVGISDKFIQQDEADQKLAFQKAFTLELAYTLCFYGLVIAALPVYTVIYDRPEILVPGLIVSVSFLASALQTPIWIAYRQMRFVRQRSLEAIDPVLSAIVTIGLAAAGLGYWSLVIGILVGSFASAIAAVITSPYPLAWRFDRASLREYFGFSWPLFLAGLSGIVIVQGSVLVGNYAVGLAGLGALALANNFAVFAGRVDDIINRTIYPAVCAVRERTDLMYEAFIKSNRLAVMWGLAFGVGLALFAGDLITYVLGERWRIAETLLIGLALILGLRQVGFNWTTFLRAVGWTRPIAASGVVALANFVAVTAPLMIWLGLDGFLIGMAVGLGLDLALRGHYLKRLFPAFDMARHLVRAIAPTLPPAVMVLALRAMDGGAVRDASVVLMEAIAYVGLTGAMCWLFERPLLNEVLGHLRRPATTGLSGSA